MTAKPSEIAAIVATIDSDQLTTGTANTDYVDMKLWRKAMFIINAGDVAASATVNFKLREATSSTGAGVTDLTGYAITQLTSGGTDTQIIVNLDESALSAGFRYVTGLLTIAGGLVDVGVVVLGFDGRYGPASNNDLSTVAEIVK